MPVTFEQLAADAERIRKDAKEEVQYRLATSRYYYSLYHRALSLANDQAASLSEAAPSETRGGSHQALRDFFEYSSTPDPEKKKLYKRLMFQLRKTHSERCSADYRLDEKYEEERLEVHVRTCKAAFDVIEEIINMGDRSKGVAVT